VTPVVVDTNILFSALLSADGRQRGVLLTADDVRFYCCRFSIVELFKHKQRLFDLSRLTEEDILQALSFILARLTFHDELSLSQASVAKADRLCADVDPKDTPFVALAIELGGRLWTGDKALVRGLRAQGFDQFYLPPELAP
jgi:predicted nucleic acid-binding protein